MAIVAPLADIACFVVISACKRILAEVEAPAITNNADLAWVAARRRVSAFSRIEADGDVGTGAVNAEV